MKIVTILLATALLHGAAGLSLRNEVQSLVASTAGENARRELRTNRDEVKKAEERRCDTVFWGKEIDHGDYVELIVRGALDVMGGGGSQTIAKLKDMLKDQVQAFGVDMLKQILLDGKKLTGSQGGYKVYIDGGVKSYKHTSWTYKCCFYKWYKSCCCKRCGIAWTKSANTHQPYVCIRKSSIRTGGSSSSTSNHNIQIRFGTSGHCLDSPGRNHLDSVHLWTCIASNPNQRWDIVNGNIRLHGTNLCLDNKYNRAANGNQLVVYQCTGSPAQKWSFRSINGVNAIYNTVYPSYCVDVHMGALNNGQKVQLWQCLENGNQKWSRSR